MSAHIVGKAELLLHQSNSECWYKGYEKKKKKNLTFTQAWEDVVKQFLNMFLPLAPVWCRARNKPSDLNWRHFWKQKNLKHAEKRKITSDGFPCHCLPASNGQTEKRWEPDTQNAVILSAEIRALPFPPTHPA